MKKLTEQLDAIVEGKKGKQGLKADNVKSAIKDLQYHKTLLTKAIEALKNDDIKT